MVQSNGGVVQVRAFPELAPLPTSMVLHLFEQHAKVFGSHRANTAPTLDEALEQTRASFQRVWAHFVEEVKEKRTEVFDVMDPVVRVGGPVNKLLVPEWVREKLSLFAPEHEQITPQALTRWKNQGTLRYKERGQPEEQSVAALLIARMVDNRERGFLPSEIDAREPWWWCWSQAVPQLVNKKLVPSPIVPCPLPLPQSIPASTLLWSPWAGAAWDPLWLQIGYLGAIRWAGATLERGRVRWHMDLKELKKWDSEMDTLGPSMGILEGSDEAIQAMAKLTLLRLAPNLLGPSFRPPVASAGV